MCNKGMLYWQFFCPYKLDVECNYTFYLYTGFDTLMLSSVKRKKMKIGQRNRFCGKSDWWKYALLQNKRGRWFRVPPPPHRSFENWWGNIDILHIIHHFKGNRLDIPIYLKFLKIFWFREFMSKFSRNDSQWLGANVQNIQTLNISTYIIYHFKARDLEIPLIEIFSRDV